MDLNIEGCPVQGSLNVFACIAPLKASMKVDIYIYIYSLERLEPGHCNAAFTKHLLWVLATWPRKST